MQKMTAPHIIHGVEAIDVETSPLPNPEDNSLNKDNSTNGLSDTTRKRAAKKVFGELFSPQQNQAPKRGRLSTVLNSQDNFSTLSSGGKPEEGSPTLDDNVVFGAPSHEFENQPLSKWLERIRNPSTEPTPMNDLEQPMENREKNQKDISVHDEISEKPRGTEVSIPKMVDKHPVLLMEPRNLPFTKNNHLWKILEDMEALKIIPQNPHFKPLEQIKEPLREGKAIGYMVNFANVFRKISELKFGDPKTLEDDILEVLTELEMHGFSVRLMQDRVEELVTAKGEEEYLLDHGKELNSRIQERYQEKGKIEEEIGGITEEIRKLEEKLSVSVSAKGIVEEEILALGERLFETEESIENVRRGFEGGSILRL